MNTGLDTEPRLLNDDQLTCTSSTTLQSYRDTDICPLFKLTILGHGRSCFVYKMRSGSARSQLTIVGFVYSAKAFSWTSSSMLIYTLAASSSIPYLRSRSDFCAPHLGISLLGIFQVVYSQCVASYHLHLFSTIPDPNSSYSFFEIHIYT